MDDPAGRRRRGKGGLERSDGQAQPCTRGQAARACGLNTVEDLPQEDDDEEVEEGLFQEETAALAVNWQRARSTGMIKAQS